MKKIGILSDTHSYWDNNFIKYFKSCDEIWHAGDIGELKITDQLKKIAPLKGVYGNIDNHQIRQEFPHEISFNYGAQNIFMTHIGGYPKKYNKRCFEKLQKLKPQIFVCGHSHICKIIYDENLKLLCINPGAAGIVGFHKIRTIVRFELHTDKIANLEVIELGSRKRLPKTV
tara:strand:+ start:84 stop:599 length:516 start_codon:yes stop_codon:yes gene_type:complete